MKQGIVLRVLSLVLIIAAVTVTAAAKGADDMRLAGAPMPPEDPTTAPTQATTEATVATTQTEPEQTEEAARTEPEEPAVTEEAPQGNGEDSSFPWKSAAILGVILLGCTGVMAGILSSRGKGRKRNVTSF